MTFRSWHETPLEIDDMGNTITDLATGRQWRRQPGESDEQFAQRMARNGVKITPEYTLKEKMIHRQRVIKMLHEDPSQKINFSDLFAAALKDGKHDFGYMGVTFDLAYADELMRELYPGAKIVDGRPLV